MFRWRAWIAFFSLFILLVEQVPAASYFSINTTKVITQPEAKSDSNATPASISSTCQHRYGHQSIQIKQQPTPKSHHTLENNKHCSDSQCSCFNGHCCSALTGIVTVYSSSYDSQTLEFSQYDATLMRSTIHPLYRPPILGFR